MQTSQVLSLSPSFNTYSSSRLTEIAARVVEEFRNEQSEIYYDDDDDDDYYRYTEDSALEKSFNVESSLEKPRIEEEKEEDGEQEDDFEFSFVCREPELSPISADEIFYNGQIKPVFPLFNTDLLLGDDEVVGSEGASSKPRRRLSLGKLMTEDRDPPSCSSSEADELEGLPPGTYCVWMPKKEEKEAGKCKKSNSTGSSKRWRFRDLLNRSNSDGKDTFVFLTPSASAKAKKNEEKVEKSVSAGDGKFSGIPKSKGVSVGGEGEIPATSCHEANYVRNRRAMEGEKRRSFLPYKQDLVGFFANVNGLNRNLRPF